MRATLPKTLPLLLALSLSPACTEFPALDGTVPPAQANGPYPDLVPLAPLVARANTSTGTVAEIEQTLSPRLAALRARADGLRGPVIPPTERDRMTRTVR